MMFVNLWNLHVTKPEQNKY